MGKSRPISDTVLKRSELPQQAVADQPRNPPDHAPGSRIADSTHFFFYRYLMNGSGRSPGYPDCLAIIYAREAERGVSWPILFMLWD
jgi:hypothetical protein